MMAGRFFLALVAALFVLTGCSETIEKTIQIQITNELPVADCGADLAAVSMETVILDGSGSFDPDGTIVSYRWTQIAGTEVALTAADTAQAEFTAPSTVEVDLLLVFQLEVEDDGGFVDTDTVIVAISPSGAPVNLPPVADASASSAGFNENTMATLTASASSDPDGFIVAYRWAQIFGTPVGLINANTGTPSFRAPFTGSSGEVLAFSLEVEDNEGLTDTCTLSVSIINTNAAPVADAGSPQTVDEGAVVFLDGTGSTDSDGNIRTYTWTQIGGPAVTLVGADTATPSFLTPVVSESGATLLFELVVKDYVGETGTASVSVEVLDANWQPTANAGSNLHGKTGTPMSLDGTGSSDPDGDPLTYAWTIVELPPGSAATLSATDAAAPSFVPDLSGLYIFALTVNDGTVTSAVDRVRVGVVDGSYVPCSSDNLSGIPATGSVNVVKASDLVPLCDGEVLLADTTSNRVVLVNAFTGVSLDDFQLSSAPNLLELDKDNGLLYASHTGSSSVSKINLVTGEVRSIALPDFSYDIAAGNDGRIFVTYGATSGHSDGIIVIDGLTETIVNQITTYNVGLFVGYDRVNNQLLTGVKGYSPSYLYRYSHNSLTDALTYEESRSDVGSNGQDLAVSPAGGRAAFPVGGGNSGYVIFDFDSTNLKTVYGSWNTGAYPTSADFSPHGDFISATNSDVLLIYNVQTHVLKSQWDPAVSGCTSPLITKIRYSGGGGAAFALYGCTYGTANKIGWLKP